MAKVPKTSAENLTGDAAHSDSAKPTNRLERWWAPMLAFDLAAAIGLLPGLLRSWLGGAFRGQPEDLDERLSPAAHALVERAFSDLGPASLVDYHAHIMGVGAGDTRAEVNPAMLTGTVMWMSVAAGVFGTYW